jgi:hypothetical protein
LLTLLMIRPKEPRTNLRDNSLDLRTPDTRLSTRQAKMLLRELPIARVN